MRATDLMIGDWVLYKSSQHRISALSDSVAHLEYVLIGQIEDIQPIPLTAEMLWKNEWWRISDAHDWNVEGFEEWHKDEVSVEFFRKQNKPPLFWSDSIGVDVVYVHELQHALRLCGLNELADNFKI